MSIRVYNLPSRRNSNFLNSLSVNSILIITNVVIFILFTILIISKILSLEYIAIKPSSILQGKYLWTFLTSMFMHGNLFHLFVNMVSLFFVGSLVEKILGRRRYFWFYLFSGLFAALLFVLLSLVFVSDFNALAVGASGAIFGLIGLLVLLTPNLPVYVMFIPIPIKLKYAGPGMLAVLWLISSAAGLGIGNTAHLGGLVAGLIYGLYLRSKYPNKIKNIQRVFS